MVATVAWIGSGRVDAAESTTGWSALKISGTGGGPSAAVADGAYEGSGAVTCTVNKQRVALFFDIGSGNELDFSGGGAEENELVYAWASFLAPGLLLSQSAGGFGIFLETLTPSASQYHLWYFHGNDTYKGGFRRLVLDPTLTVSASAGTAINLASVRYFGVFADVGGTTARFDNLICDAIDVGNGLRVYGTSTTDDLTGDLLADEATNAYGIVSEKVGVADSLDSLEIAGVIELGDNVGTNAADLTDVSRSFTCANPTYYNGSSVVPSAPTDSFGIRVVGNGTGDTDLEVGKKVGTGDDASGRNGWSIQGNDNYDFFIDFDDGAVETNLWYGCRFTRLAGALSWGTVTTHECIGNTFDDCSQFDPVGGIVIRACAFNNYMDVDAALLWNASMDIKHCSFLANTDTTNDPAGIEHAAAGTFMYVGLKFNGNDYDVLNSVSATTVDSYSESNRDGDQALGNGTVGAVGQSFDWGASTGYLTNARFYLSKTGTPTGDIVARLYALSGTLGGGDDTGTGPELARSDKCDVTKLDGTPTLYQFNFSDEFQPTGGTDYVISVEIDTTFSGDGSNHVLVGVDSSSPSHTGNMMTSAGVSAVDLNDHYTDKATNGSLTIGSITADSDLLYLAALATGDSADGLSSISGLGLTWNLLANNPIAPGGGGTEAKLWVWIGSGSPSTGNLSISIDNSDQCVGLVARFSGADLSSLPSSAIDNEEVLTGSGTTSYSDAIDGSENGMAVVLPSYGRRALTTVGESFDFENDDNNSTVRNGTTTGDASLALTHKSLSADDTYDYSGTISGAANWALQALTLLAKPAGAWTAVSGTDVCFYVSRDGLVHIDASEGANPGTFVNTGSPPGGTAILNPVIHTVNGLAVGERVVWIRVADGVELENKAASGGEASYSYNYTGDVAVYVQILSTARLIKYPQVTLGATSTTLPASLITDRFFSNPT